MPVNFDLPVLGGVLGVGDTFLALCLLKSGEVAATMSISASTGNSISQVSDDGIACLTLNHGVLVIRISER